MKPVLQMYAAASACVLLAACGGGIESSSTSSGTAKLAPASVLRSQATFSGARWLHHHKDGQWLYRTRH